MNILALVNHVGDFGFGLPDELIDSADMDLEHLLLCINGILEEIEGNSRVPRVPHYPKCPIYGADMGQ